MLDVEIISVLSQHGGDPFSSNLNGQEAINFLKVASKAASLKKRKDAVVGELIEFNSGN